MKKYLPWIIGGLVLLAALFLIWQTARRKRCGCRGKGKSVSTTTSTTTTQTADTQGTTITGTPDDGLHAGNNTQPIDALPVPTVYSGNPIL